MLRGEQLPAIIELIQCFAIHEFRKEAERNHFDVFCNDHFAKEWHTYCASLLGYSKEMLIAKLAEVGRLYSSQEKALLALDKFELIRTAFIDLFLALGKSETYAKNVGEIASSMAKKMDLSFNSLKSALYRSQMPASEKFLGAKLQLN